MPVPVKKSKVSDDNLLNMVAWYNSKANSIVVNLDQIKYVLSSKKEHEHFSSPLCPYCDVASSVDSIISSKLCIVTLFLKDEKRIKKSGQTIVSPSSIIPQASHVNNGLWFMATQKLLTF